MKKRRNKTGVIDLYSRKGNRIVSKRYTSIWNRKQIVDDWRKYYQDRFNGFYYHIIPDLKTVSVIERSEDISNETIY